MENWLLDHIRNSIEDSCNQYNLNAFYTFSTKDKDYVDNYYLWKVPLIHKNDSVSLNFIIFENIDHLNYMVYTNPESPECTTIFLDLEEIKTDSLEYAIDSFNQYLEYKNQEIPEKYLPDYMTWTKKYPLPVLEFVKDGFDPVPIYFQTDIQILRDKGRKLLEVSRGENTIAWKNDLVISYDSPKVREIIRISNHKIYLKSSQDLSFLYQTYDLNDKKQADEYLTNCFKQSKKIENIPKYLENLKELLNNNDLESIL